MYSEERVREIQSSPAKVFRTLTSDPGERIQVRSHSRAQFLWRHKKHFLGHSYVHTFSVFSFSSLLGFTGESNQYYPPQMRPGHQVPPQRNELNYGLRELRYKVAASAAARK